MRTLLAALTMFLAAGACAAGRTYAVMSFVGDGLLVVQHRTSAGSSLSPNARQFVTLADPAFDRTALLAVDGALRRADPSAKVVLLGGRDPAALEAQSRTLGAPGAAQAVADALRPHLPATGATHLVLVLKSRHAGRLRAEEGHADAGELEGLGFYVDPTLVTRHDASGLADRGFLAPFAYIDVALVDLGTGKVLAERPVHASTPYPASKSGGLDPWEALPAEEKTRVLEALLRKEVEAAVPALLGAR